MRDYIKRADIKNVLLNKKNIMVTFPVQNQPSDINNAAKIFNLGIDIFLFDTSGLTPKSAVELGFKLRQLCSLFNILFFVKDRCDYAKILEAEGVFLGPGCYDIKFARNILHSDIIFGCNIETESEILEGYDYVISKKNINTPKPCYLDVLDCPKTLSNKVFINSTDIGLIKKFIQKGLF